MDAVASVCTWTLYLFVHLACSADAATIHLVARQTSNSSADGNFDEGSQLPVYASGLIFAGVIIFCFISVLGVVLCCLCYRSGWLSCRRWQNYDYYGDTTNSQVSLTRIRAADLTSVPSLSHEPPLSMSLLTIGDTPDFEGQTIICGDLTSHSATNGYDVLQRFSYRRGSDVLSSDVNLQVPPRETHGTSSDSISSQSQECGEEVVAECMKIRHEVSLPRSLCFSRQHSHSLPDLPSCSRLASSSSFSKSDNFETGFLHPPAGADLPGSNVQNPNALERIIHPQQLILQEHTPREPKRRTGSLFSLTSQDSGSSTHSAPSALTRYMLVDKQIPLVTPV